MNQNVDQFCQTFIEEANEILADLESSLFQLSGHPDDKDLLNRVFRSMHTLKGSGAMFGFDSLAEFTHNLENAFDAVRNGKIKFSEGLADLTLRSLDHVRALLRGEPDDGMLASQLLLDLRRLWEDAHPVPNESAKAIEQTSFSACDRGAEINWSIHFSPHADLMRKGADPLLPLHDLAQIGNLTASARIDALPPLAEIDPERCYISWDLALGTRADLNTIRDAFIFVEDCCELTIGQDCLSTSDQSGDATEGLTEARQTQGGRRASDSPDTASSIRVAAPKLDHFVNLVGELVTVQARLSELATRRDDTDLSAVSEEIERLSSALRENSMDMRMMPIRGTFDKFRRLVHDLARSLGKRVDLVVEGAETELDKSVIDQLSDPLMHLIRNAMDHGVGSPDERLSRGKPANAKICLAARYAGASVLISVSDDGRGIDIDAVRAKAVKQGLITAEAVLSESEIYSLIFQPGFSTAAQVTDISGRGVGMDVVRRNIDKLRGSIDVESTPGQGTKITLRLPLTLAIIDGLLVNVGEAFFVLPLTNVLECIELSRGDSERANGRQLINVRDQLVPYIRLRAYFQLADSPALFEQVILVDTGEGRYGLVVDGVLGNCQTMIKSLGRVYRDVQAVSGATILGNGQVALILDPLRLVEECIRNVRPAVRGHPGVPGIPPQVSGCASAGLAEFA